MSLLSKGVTKEHCIKQFQSNRIVFLNKSRVFRNVVSRIITPELFKNRKYYQLLQLGMEAVKKNNLNVVNRYKYFVISMT